MTRIGITGATGMIGTNLLTQLDAAAELRARYRPIALVRRESCTEALQGRGVEVRLVDYRDVGSFAGKLEDLEVVVHLAGLTKAYRKAEFYEVNAAGTRAILEAVSRYGEQVRHFLFSSSMAACGPSASPQAPKDEEAECNPVSHYGASKLEAEQAIREAGLDWTILRLPVVLGPHDYYGLRLLRIARGGWLWTFGPGEDYFSWVCAQDLARVLLRMIGNEAVFREVVNVCYDDSARAVDLYARVRRLSGLDPQRRLHHLPRWSAFVVGAAANALQSLCRRASCVNLDKVRELTAKNFVITNRKLKQRLGMARFEEAGALAETVQWFRERGLL
ncbi:MAG: NAD-dependent epimerase/dehydratase family protein [Spirochaetales bacterium]|nr:NAD-dependent epimerase/dehydratase family protein [Spirochaetales bacterium]